MAERKVITKPIKLEALEELRKQPSLPPVAPYRAKTSSFARREFKPITKIDRYKVLFCCCFLRR